MGADMHSYGITPDHRSDDVQQAKANLFPESRLVERHSARGSIKVGLILVWWANEHFLTQGLLCEANMHGTLITLANLLSSGSIYEIMSGKCSPNDCSVFKLIIKYRYWVVGFELTSFHVYNLYSIAVNGPNTFASELFKRLPQLHCESCWI